MFHFHEVA